ncbi:SWIRM domain-containing protein [Xylaria sp. CBS 124048]|nr:SWIRM domain-containing protein [Xylaria sp. CBS 124048]
MALSSSRIVASKKVCDINNLMSPPEPSKLESFSQSNIHSNTAATHNNDNNDNNDNENKDNSSSSRSSVNYYYVTNKSDGNHDVASNDMSKADASMCNKRQVPAPIQTLSPPISPATQLHDNAMNVDIIAKDPILYPSHEGTGSPANQPLFIQEEAAETKRTVDSHVLARPAELFRDAAPPEKEDYELALSFRSQVMKLYQRDPKTWLKRERAYLIADRQAQARNRQFKLQPILPAKPQPIRKEAQRAKPTRTPRVTKPTTTRQAPAKQAHISPSTRPRPIRAGPGPSTTSTAPGIPSGLSKAVVRGPSSTPDPSPRRTTQTRIDDDFNSVPDYCPPKESLARKNFNSLKMDFKTAANDLTNDPNRDLLHPEELVLASNLRLSCAVYLTSKRRIFVKRLECLRHPKEFRKTDAQQACNIDVNKASKLWTAFDMVGWLDPSWVAPYL